MEMVPKMGKKKEVLTVEKRKAMATRSTYFNASKKTARKMYCQAMGRGDGYIPEAYATTTDMTAHRMSEAANSEQATPQNFPMRYCPLDRGRPRTLKLYRRSMSFQSEVPPRETARSRRMKEMRESDRVMESSVTCRMERELTAGTNNNNNETRTMPLKTRSLTIPMRAIRTTFSII
jgi:hypothetical protein